MDSRGATAPHAGSRIEFLVNVAVLSATGPTEGDADGVGRRWRHPRGFRDAAGIGIGTRFTDAFVGQVGGVLAKSTGLTGITFTVRLPLTVPAFDPTIGRA
jgi:hypothetical protein